MAEWGVCVRAVALEVVVSARSVVPLFLIKEAFLATSWTAPGAVLKWLKNKLK
ncbi:hypothetical protein ACFLYM_02070 [Chloroflexota bacterium]